MFVLRRLEQMHECLDAYRPELAFRSHLKNWFRQNKQMGSRDRKELSSLCYGYFRLGGLTSQVKKEELNPWLIYLFLGHNENYIQFLQEKGLLPEDLDESAWSAFLAHFGLSEQDKFPSPEAVSSQIDLDAYLVSLRTQSKSWFRVKRDKLSAFITRLKDEGVSFEQAGHSVYCPEVDLTKLFGDTLYFFGEMQDLCSTYTTIDLPVQKDQLIWECCAASGGKALSLQDTYPDAKLIASDIRDDMRRNFRQRFNQSKLKAPKFFACDLTEMRRLPDQVQDALEAKDALCVFVDAPCTGSGTWNRQPEQLRYSDAERIQEFSTLQSDILKGLAPVLRSGDVLVYVTCSVYTAENEAHHEFLLAAGYELVKAQYFTASDCLYRSVWKKS